VRIVVNIDAAIENPRAVALAARGFMEGVISVNRVLMRQAAARGRPFPDLYDSGIKFRREPWAGKLEEFADCETVLRRGWGDCDDLVCLRVAQLRERGIDAKVKIYWRTSKPAPGDRRTLFHAQVRSPRLPGERRGRVEDPSRRLGG